MQINTEYFRGIFVDDMGKAMNDLLKMEDAFTTNIPYDFKYKNLFDQLESTRKSAIQTRKELFLCIESMIYELNQIEKNAIEIADESFTTNISATPYHEKRVNEVDQIAEETQEITDAGAQTIKEITKADIENLNSNYKAEAQGFFSAWASEELALLRKAGKKVKGVANTVGEIGGEIKQSVKQYGRELADVYDELMDFNFKGAFKNFGKLAKHTGATVTNTVVSGFEGVCKFGEGLIDYNKMIWSARLTPVTFIYDKFMGDNVTGSLWRDTMNSVADDNVGDTIDSFYQSDVGKAIDKNAYAYGKSDSAAQQATVGISESAPALVLTMVTGGTYAIPIGLISGASKMGRYAQRDWQEDRANSVEGIEYLYKKGKISEEYYNAVKTIQGYSSEQWENITAAHNSGLISDEDFDALNQIKNMPKEWTTAENAVRTISAAALTGAIEAASYIIGSEIGKWKGFGASTVVDESGNTIRMIGSANRSIRALSSVVKLFDYASIAKINALTNAMSDIISDKDADIVRIVEDKAAEGDVLALYAISLGLPGEALFVLKDVQLRPGEYIQESGTKNTSKNGLTEVVKPDEVIIPEGYDSNGLRKCTKLRINRRGIYNP